jgi:hypothetical protein
MGERRCAYRASVGKPERKRNLEDPGVDGRIILKIFFRKWYWRMYLIDLAQDAIVSAVMKLCEKFLD